MKLCEVAIELAKAGLSVIPTDEKKIPIGKWGDFQVRIATPENFTRMFANPNASSMALVGGRVSGNLYQLDFEGKDYAHKPMCPVYPAWSEQAKTNLARLGHPSLFEKLPIVRTRNNGYHVRWRVSGNVDLKTERLALGWSGDLDKKDKPIPNLLIESKSEGGYAIIPPSIGYELIQGSLLDIPTIPVGIHEQLVELARSFHTALQSQPSPQPPHQPSLSGLPPGDDFNLRGDHRAFLNQHGWQFSHEDERAEYWTRPGKSTREGHSAGWTKIDVQGRFGTLKAKRFKVFTTADPAFDGGESCDLFGLYAKVEHGGDFKKAARALAKEGYGEQAQKKRFKKSSPDDVVVVIPPPPPVATKPPIPSDGGLPHGDFIQFSDGWRAKQLVKNHGRDLRYCSQWNQWLIWDGKRWAIDRTLEIMRRAKSVTVKLLREAANCLESGDDVGAKMLRIQAKNADTRAKYDAMISLARSEPGIPILPESLDTDPWRLTVLNGTVDLQKGDLVSHHREHLITKLAPVFYDENAKCPLWLSAMDRWMDGKQEIIDFIQRAVGYSLTGRVHESVLLILYGDGCNGKTIFLETLTRMMGEYARHSEPDLLLVKQHENHPTGLADLMGARFVTTTEIGEHVRLNEPLIKRLTGGDRMKARFMREDWFEFEPTHKIWVGVNHRPVIRGTDYGIWRRIRLVPFTVEIPERDIIPREIFLEMLAEERAGILNWAIEGCLKWQQDGIGIPDAIQAATADYRSRMDIVGRFIDEQCETEGECQASALYQAFRDWCEHNGENPISQRVFGEKLAERGLEKTRSGPKGSFIWRPIQFVSGESA